MKINYLIRSLLLKKVVHDLIIEICDLYKKHGDKFEIYPTNVNSCLNSVYSEDSLYLDSEAIKQNTNRCYEGNELKMLDLLKINEVIELKYDSGEDGGSCIAEIKIINHELFKDISNWVLKNKLIITYGLFSLNTLTGEAYCKDNYHLFKPGSGYYDLLKEFLKKKNHFLNFEEMVNIQQQEYKKVGGVITRSDYVYDERKNSELQNKAKNNIKYLQKNLKMREGLGELFKTYEKRGFILLPDLD